MESYWHTRYQAIELLLLQAQSRIRELEQQLAEKE